MTSLNADALATDPDGLAWLRAVLADEPASGRRIGARPSVAVRQSLMAPTSPPPAPEPRRSRGRNQGRAPSTKRARQPVQTALMEP